MTKDRFRATAVELPRGIAIPRRWRFLRQALSLVRSLRMTREGRIDGRHATADYSSLDRASSLTSIPGTAR